jgi:hypothetical protein
VTGHVFLTFSATDATDAYIQAVIGRLSAVGLSVHAQQEISAIALTPATRKLVDSCGAMVPIIMPATESSHRVRLEVEYAHARGKPVLALWVDGAVPDWLAYTELDNVAGRRPPSPEFLEKLRQIALTSAESAIPAPPVIGLRPGRPGPGPQPRVTGRPPPPGQPPWVDLTPEQATGLLPRLDRSFRLAEHRGTEPGQAPNGNGRIPDPVRPTGSLSARRVWLLLAFLAGLVALLAASAGVMYVIAR